jgi:hypothetical protein
MGSMVTDKKHQRVRRSFTDEFKAGAVRLVIDGCRSSRLRDPCLTGFSRAFPPDEAVFLTTFPPCA